MESVKIVIAEDEMQNSLLLKRIVQRLQHQPVMFTDGDQVLSYFESNTADLIIMDLSMPTIDGLEVAKIIRSGSTAVSKDIPIVLISGNDAAYMENVCNEVGANSFICKPFDLQVVIATINKWIQ